MTWMVEEIRRRGGAVPFRAFMELALYHPRRGYYRGSRSPVGRRGDFLTAPAASSWYAAVLAGVLEEAAGRVGGLTVVDAGSGDGSFIQGVCDALGGRVAAVVAGLVSVESSPAMRRLQRRRLGGVGVGTAWKTAVGELQQQVGPTLLHASELYDALPVHRLVGRADGLRELWVAADGDLLRWQEREPSAAAAGYLSRHGVELAPGQVAEVNVEAEPLHRRLLAAAAGDGLAVILDYGYETRRLYDPRGRAGGTLACYRNHRLSRDPLLNPGEQDITAHVNWDDLRRAGEAAGWEEVGLWPLAELLVRAGLERVMERRGVGQAAAWDAATVAARQEIKRLLDPDGMGADLGVLVQARGALVEPARLLLADDRCGG